MNSTDRRDHDNGDEERHERIIDVSGTEPMVVEDEDTGYPYLSQGTERVRVFVAGGGARTCAIPAILILLLICCSCIAFWSLTDNLF
ncbi:MAG: hypothetical protein R3A46_13625 [Thermomicrobiales bacterium]